MAESNEYVRKVAEEKYKYGFTTDIHTEIIDKGLNEDVIRLISSKKEEPEWLLEFRLQAYRYWLTQEEPKWGHLQMPEIDYQAISYYADPTKKKDDNGKKEIDPELMKTFDKLGIPLEERMALSGMAVDAVMDSVSVKTTFKEKLAEMKQASIEYMAKLDTTPTIKGIKEEEVSKVKMNIAGALMFNGLITNIGNAVSLLHEANSTYIVLEIDKKTPKDSVDLLVDGIYAYYKENVSDESPKYFFFKQSDYYDENSGERRYEDLSAEIFVPIRKVELPKPALPQLEKFE